VIPDEKDQNSFVKFLLQKLQTIDGVKNSAVEVIKGLQSRQQMVYKWKNKIEMPGWLQ
jgi:hypothetical protein